MSDISERSGPARALIGTDQQGHLVVLATDSAWVAWDCEHVCTGAEDIGLASTSIRVLGIRLVAAYADGPEGDLARQVRGDDHARP